VTKNLGEGMVVTRINPTSPRPFAALRVTIKGTFDTTAPEGLFIIRKNDYV
jgi:hypothetical protein